MTPEERSKLERMKWELKQRVQARQAQMTLRSSIYLWVIYCSKQPTREIITGEANEPFRY